MSLTGNIYYANQNIENSIPLADEIEAINIKINIIEADVIELTSDFSTLQTNDTTQDGRLDVLEADMTIVKTDITNLETITTDHETRITDVENHASVVNNMETFIYNTGTTSITIPANVEKVVFSIIGASGGGSGGENISTIGTSGTQRNNGFGGGSGGYCEVMYINKNENTFTCSIGAGGVGGNAGTPAPTADAGDVGTNGGNTSITINGITITSYGGTGGLVATAGTGGSFNNSIIGYDGEAGALTIGGINKYCDYCKGGNGGTGGRDFRLSPLSNPIYATDGTNGSDGLIIAVFYYSTANIVEPVLIEKSRLLTIETDINNLETRMGTAETDINNLETRMGTAETDINNLETRMGTAETDINNLESRMGTAETDINNLETRMGTAETDINNLETITTAQDIRITQNESDISALGATDIGTRVTNAETDIDTLQSDMTTAENDIIDLKTDVNTLEANVLTAQTDINTLETKTQYITATTTTNLLSNLDMSNNDIINIKNLYVNDNDPLTSYKTQISMGATDFIIDAYKTFSRVVINTYGSVFTAFQTIFSKELISLRSDVVQLMTPDFKVDTLGVNLDRFEISNSHINLGSRSFTGSSNAILPKVYARISYNGTNWVMDYNSGGLIQFPSSYFSVLGTGRITLCVGVGCGITTTNFMVSCQGSYNGGNTGTDGGNTLFICNPVKTAYSVSGVLTGHKFDLIITRSSNPDGLYNLLSGGFIDITIIG